MNSSVTAPILSAADREHFLEKGYVIVRDAIPAANVQSWQDLTWQRLGYDPRDPATWEKPRVHLAPSRAVRLETFAPRAFEAICQACGGRERVWEPLFWADVMVCNLAEGADRAWQKPSARSVGWHKDGYFFRHFLDSPEQALLVIAAWTDVTHQGGGTFIAPDSVGIVARFLAKNPQGVSPQECGALIEQCAEFEELTCNAGDLIILHPFMLHAVSQNTRRRPRFISNPIVMLQEPMNFKRDDGNYSLVEAAILRALGREHLDFSARGPRETQIPDWVNRAQSELAHTKNDWVLTLDT